MYPEAAIGFSLPLEAYDYLPSSVVGPSSLIRRPSVVVRVYFFLVLVVRPSSVVVVGWW
jgi:hypothetical protein